MKEFRKIRACRTAVIAVISVLMLLLCACTVNVKTEKKKEAEKPEKSEELAIEVIHFEDAREDDPEEDDAHLIEEDEDETSDDDNDVPPLPVEPGEVALDPSWEFAEFSEINDGKAILYATEADRKGIVVGVNAGHGTKGGMSVKTFCHPDKSPKVTGGSTAEGSIKAAAVSGGMTFRDGTTEASVALKEAQILKDRLLAKGYDVLMLRDDDDVQLDNIARTVIANNVASCIISLHWDGDGLDYDKGCFYISTPEPLKDMEPVKSHWEDHEKLGGDLVKGLGNKGCKIYDNGKMTIDLTQTSYSTIPSVDVELGNAASDHGDAALSKLADGLTDGIDLYFASLQ